MNDFHKHFLVPRGVLHRQYEVLRARFVEKLAPETIAQRFGLSAGYVKNLVSDFRKNPDKAFFLPDPRGRKTITSTKDRDARIVALTNREQAVCTRDSRSTHPRGVSGSV